MQITPYLFFDGNCEQAFRYYEKHLGGKIEAMMTFEGSPAEEHVSSDMKTKIMHACLKLGDTMLMASDEPSSDFKTPQGFRVSIQTSDPDEAERMFAALADGGEVKMPMEETFWAKRFGMVKDRFGTPWMVNCDAGQD